MMSDESQRVFSRHDPASPTDLSVAGPIGTQKPVRGPSAASPGHVGGVEYEEAMSVSIVADDANTGPPRASPGPFVGGVDADPS